MADRLLFIGWGTPVRGCEGRAMESFNDAMGLLGRMQQEGRIEGFNVVLLTPNSDLNGFVTVEGSAEQITALRDDEEFQRTRSTPRCQSTAFGTSRATRTRALHAR